MIRELFGLARHVPEILQSERAECGLACIAMIAAYHGHDVDLPTLRQRFAFSALGATLREVVEVAGRLDMSSRAVKAPLDALGKLKLPAILHWDFNHFVVLTKITSDGAFWIHDPAIGRQRLSPEEVSTHYTGVVVELTPTPQFRPRTERMALPFRALLKGALADSRPVQHAVAFALLAQGLALSVPLAGQFLIDSVAPTGDLNTIDLIGVALVFVSVSLFACYLARGMVIVYLSNAIHSHLARSLFRHLVDLPLSFFQRRQTSDLMARFDSLRVIQRVLSVTFIESVVDGLGMLMALSVVALYSLAIAAIAIAGATTYALLRVALQRRYVSVNDEQIQKGSIVQTSFIETMRGIESIKVHNSQYLRDATMASQMTAWFNASARLQAQVALFAALGAVMQAVVVGAVLWVGGRMTIHGQLGIGVLLACVSLVQVFVFRFVGLVDKFADFRMLSIHRARLTDVFSVEREKAMHGSGVLSVDHLQGAIELDRVSFRYEENRPWILDEASLRIEAGEFIAVTGPSGTGKSTLLRLMLGVLDASSGAIRIDGHEIAAVGKERYRDLVGVVLQDDVLFSGTILENVCFFDPMPDMAHVEHCARMAGIHDAVAKLPMGYRTLVGDMGSLLSGGQRQRLFLARALYRRPRILFLDEATSHLDIEKEREINYEISRIGITRIVIAHRAETIQAADRVVRLVDGRLVEQHVPLYDASAA